MSPRSNDHPEAPPSVVLDLDDPGTPLPSVRPQGTVVLLISGAVNRQWAADAALALGAEWARGGRRIVLADLHLENPLLHAGLDVSNLEGMVDIFLYGASLSRIAQPVRAGEFYLIPAGTYAPDVAEIYRHPRWKKLVSGFRDTDAALILFVPAESADLEALSAWSSEAVLLGPPPERGFVDEVRERGIEVVAIMEPPATTTTPAAAAYEASPEASAPLSTLSNGVDDVTPAPAAGASEPESSRTGRSERTPGPPPEVDLELPPPPVRRRRERHGASVFMWFLLAIAVLGAAGYLVATLRPDLLPGAPPAAAPGEGPATSDEAESPGASRLGELLPYSVQVRAFTSLPAARSELAAEQRRLPSTLFFISPEEIQGVRYYKLLAGLATDTLSAVQLRDELVDRGAIEIEDASDSWSLLQFTPLAFDMGEYTMREAALSRADSLLVSEIPTYVATTPYSDGSSRWQVYGGAFRDSASAASMREMLESNGLDARLTARTGLPVTLSE
ncbi:MAG: hypothetical protein WD737_04570 [Gemmatimonadota bacterium]